MSQPPCIPADRVIAIAASLGGLHALSVILGGLPKRFPAAVAIVMHVSPDHESLLAEILRSRCRLEVREAETGNVLCEASVFVAPPNHHMTVTAGGTIKLSSPTADKIHHARNRDLHCHLVCRGLTRTQMSSGFWMKVSAMGGVAYEGMRTLYQSCLKRFPLFVGSLWCGVNAAGAQSAPTIQAQPEAQTVLRGLGFYISVTASGTPPLRYQWLRDGKAVPQFASDALYVASATESDIGGYSVVISNSSGSVTSRWAQIDVTPGPLNGWIVRQFSPSSVQPVSNPYLQSVVYGNGMFVAVGTLLTDKGFSGVILTSADGASWTSHSVETVSGLGDVTYHAGTYVAVVPSTPRSGLLTSTNGLDWIFRERDSFPVMPGLYPFYQAVGGGGVFVVAGGDFFSGGAFPVIYSSTDTVQWFGGVHGGAPRFTGAAYGAGKFVLVGDALNGGSSLMVSTNGQDWTFVSLPLSSIRSGTFVDVVYAKNQFVLSRTTSLSSTDSRTEILVSSNGISWTESAIIADRLNSLAYGGDVFVGVGDFSIYSSTDPRSWHREFTTSKSFGLGLTSVAYGEGSFVVVNGEGKIMQSVGLGRPRLAVSATGEGVVTRVPDQTNYSVGDTVTLTATPSRWYNFGRWSDGTTTNPRIVTVTSDDARNIYGCTFAAMTQLETVAYGSVARSAPLGTPAILVDGQFVPSGLIRSTHTAHISILTTFPRGVVVYTLDGTAPTFAARPYSGPIELKHSATIRALAFDVNFSRATEADPVEVDVEESTRFLLSTTTTGGGTISVSPLTGGYESNAPVSIIANPNPGWVFLKWRGNASANNPVLNVRMTSDLCLEAVFGTKLTTRATGKGTILRRPSSDLYPYGTRVELIGIPEPDNGFALWGDAATGAVNPVRIVVTNSNPTVSSLFTPLSSGQFSLTVQAEGLGSVSMNSSGNRFTQGQRVTLIARPEPGQEFLGWSEQTKTLMNPLSLVMDQSVSITAAFSSRPSLHLTGCPDPFNSQWLDLQLIGDWNARYELEQSTDLHDWRELGNITNSFGISDWLLVPTSVEQTRFFRVRNTP